MKYFIICKDNEPIAIVGHSYLEGDYVIKSKSKSFYEAFSFSVNTSKGIFRKFEEGLKYFKLEITNPSWCDIILRKSCGDFWNFSEYNFEGKLSELLEKIFLK